MTIADTLIEVEAYVIHTMREAICLQSRDMRIFLNPTKIELIWWIKQELEWWSLNAGWADQIVSSES